MFTDVSIVKKGEFIRIECLSLGIRLKIDDNAAVYLTLTNVHKNNPKLQGLCGNYNDNPYGEFSFYIPNK